MLLPLLLVVLVSFSANAAHHERKNWNWWENEKITQKLDVSEDQQTQLNDIAEKFEPAFTEAKTNYMEKKKAYKEAKSDKAISNADIIKAFDASSDAKYKMKRVKLDRYLEMRDVLTQEQATELCDIKKAKKGKMMKKHHKMKEMKQMKEEMEDTTN